MAWWQQFAYHNVASEEQATAPLAQLGVSEEKQRLFRDLWAHGAFEILQPYLENLSTGRNSTVLIMDWQS